LTDQIADGVVADMRLEKVARGEVNEIGSTSTVEHLNVLAFPEWSTPMDRALRRGLLV
jgi:hypothetical protein